MMKKDRECNVSIDNQNIAENYARRKIDNMRKHKISGRAFKTKNIRITGNISGKWKNATIVHIPKTEDTSKCENYQGVGIIAGFEM